MAVAKRTTRRTTKSKGNPRLKMIVHPDHSTSGKMPPALKKKWMGSIYRMKRNPKKVLLIVTSQRKLKMAGDLGNLIGYALKHLGRKRVVVLTFSVAGKVKDYPMHPLTEKRNFEAKPKGKLKKILEAKGIKVEKIDRIKALGIYLSECVKGEAELAAGVLGLSREKIHYLKGQSMEAKR